MGKVYRIHPKSLRKFSNDLVIYWEKTGTGCASRPKFIRLNGQWCVFDPDNQSHTLKLKEIESSAQDAKVINFPLDR